MDCWLLRHMNDFVHAASPPRMPYSLQSESKTCIYFDVCLTRSRYSDWPRAGRSGDRIPMGARFSAPGQTGRGAHPAYCTMGTGSFPGVKRGRGVTLTPYPFKCRGHERVELYLYSTYGPYGLYRVSVPVQGGTLLLPLPSFTRQ